DGSLSGPVHQGLQVTEEAIDDLALSTGGRVDVDHGSGQLENGAGGSAHTTLEGSDKIRRHDRNRPEGQAWTGDGRLQLAEPRVGDRRAAARGGSRDRLPPSAGA